MGILHLFKGGKNMNASRYIYLHNAPYIPPEYKDIRIVYVKKLSEMSAFLWRGVKNEY